MKISFDHYNDDVQKVIYNTRPGITGIGSVIFRDEEKIISESGDMQAAYKQIFRYKGQLELWYQEHISFFTDTMIIFLTAWCVFFPASRLVYRVFPSLPKRGF
jgi:lipopolysaccharide/colanic/teichoic acid biosynthesis glycosyltransferase